MRMAPAAPMRGPTMMGGQALDMAENPLVVYASFAQIVDLIREKRDVRLLVEVETGVKLAKYAPGRIEFEMAPGAASDLAARLSQRLQGWTGARWGVSVVGSGGAATIAEDRDAEQNAAKAEAMGNALVQAVMLAFPGAKIAEIRTAEAMAANAAVEALPEVEDEWDPFEDS
jgi:DNA polymerase III subunit gamma/tau